MRVMISCHNENMISLDEPAIDWGELFGIDRAVEIEIGCGKGVFLLEYARAHPEINLLGMENQPRWVRWIEQRLERAPLANARVVCVDAALVVTRFVRAASVRAYHVYFPDPWWKRRHHKRRLVSGELAAGFFRTLEPRSGLHLATDVESRFAAMREELAAVPFESQVFPTPTPAGRPLTNF